MYLLRATFHICEPAHLDLLIRAYEGVHGELEIKEPADEITWRVNPFRTLAARDYAFPYVIYASLAGPQTVLAHALPLKKIISLTHEKKNLLLEWARDMDVVAQNGLKRENNLALYGRLPQEKLASLSELIIAAQLSTHVTHICIGQTGIFLLNQNYMQRMRREDAYAYLPYISLTEKYVMFLPLSFHASEGFISPHDATEELTYMNGLFHAWKTREYAGKLADYATEYAQYLKQ